MNQTNSNNLGLNSSESINLGRFLRLLLLQSKLILVIALLGFIAGLSIYLSTSKTYKVSSLLQVYSPNQTFNPQTALMSDFYNAPDTNLENLVALYTSRSNIMNLITDLNLNVRVEDLDESESLKLNILDFKSDEEYGSKIFYLKSEGENFNLLNENKNLILKGVNGEYHEEKNLAVKITYKNLNPEKLIKLNYSNPANFYNSYKNRLSVVTTTSKRSFFAQEGLVEVNFITSDIKKGKKIIDTANEIFINDNISVETEKAKKSIQFIDNQLESLEGVLDARKTQLRDFKQENKSLNVDLEVQSIVEQISNIEQKINKANLDLSQAEVNFTKDNPLYVNLKIQKDALELQRNSIEERIENLPLAQQEYIDLFRQLEISEALYSELINKKLNFSLMEASTIGNIRVVDNAFVQSLIGPKVSLIFYFTIFSLTIGLLIALFRGIFFISISNPAELRDAGLEYDILGVVPKVDDPQEALKDKRFEQSIETLILNIETVIKPNEEDRNKSCKKILFTSPTASNGKSFISKNISEALARIGNKVLLIDADLKRGDLHKIYEKSSIDLSAFKEINLENIENLTISNNLFFIPKLKKLKNTFEYLYSNLFIEKLNELESFFDFIIIDTAPALSVSDTSLLMTSTDNNFLVVRHQTNRINEIKQTVQIINQIGRSFDGIIYNDYQKPSGYYGYYDLYGDYSYRYYAERYLYDYYDEKND